MNRFIIDHHPDDIARQLCDQHIVKMPLEEAQMLCTTVWQHAPEYAEAHELYKPAYHKHPCTIWAGESRANFTYAFNLYTSMLCEYNHRYGKWHGAGNPSTTNALARPQHIIAARDFIPDGELTPHPQCFSGHDDCKTDEDWPITAYRAFYIVDKMRFARYNKGRDMPTWMKENDDETTGQ